MEIRPLRREDVRDAVDIFAERYAGLRAAIPGLPVAWEAADRLAGRLEQLAAAGPALAAHEGKELRGYIAGWILHDGDVPWVYVPEWGHGARGPDRRRTWEALYEAMLPEWLELGARVHRVTLLADDELAAGLTWLSFGTTTVDALRGMDAITAGGYAVRRATVADTDVVTGLREGLRQHLQSSPVYLFLPDPIDPDAERAKLADSAVATLLAEIGSQVVGFMRIGPAADGVATIVQDPGTASISGAFTVSDRRGAGIGRCLLDAAMTWARDGGYVRVAVDFESMNLVAARFWTATFRPVAVTMSRAIDARVQPRAGGRKTARR